MVAAEQCVHAHIGPIRGEEPQPFVVGGIWPTGCVLDMPDLEES